jgi:uncharacterized lipoprotein YddW (UPF0748 family)
VWEVWVWDGVYCIIHLLMLPLLLLCFATVTRSETVELNVSSTQYLQAAWIPTSYQSGSESQVYSMMQSLKSLGVRRVYVDVWNQGKVYFQSQTMTNLIGSSGIAADHLLWTLNAGNSLGIEVYAWFEYGFMCSYGDLSNNFAQYAKSKGWVLGQYNGFYWIDPANSDVLAFTAGIMLDAMKGYKSKGLKGVQWDDHFATPKGLGRTASQMDNAMSYMRKQLNSISGAKMSLSPATLSTALGTYNVDWNKWGQNNYYDEVIPQIYRSTYDSFKSEFDYTMKTIGSTTKSKFNAAGIRVDGSGSPTPWAEVNNMIWYSNANARGGSVWYAHGIIELYPSNFKNIWG